ncbi:hypothetical protein [Legionella micdadei]|uniref:Integral membrane protein (PIN domain superfamily) n=1 Tax=Legionella micdadei TaxID=451 RepID=A0A098GHJ5_LEGMI|nr:hypothetical protein [Legionella micdadei]ARG97114.1 hypothetical protein B6N58_05250 [Legionella micdadei]ARH00628.1 hypothetical protein B6V88_09450 [Legionella micdadei]KTD29291.1 Integral membrane protein (PIN domain superfamily) [Legionella micdadei]NSL17336.1 hypothetical protein [Legionella micdadei]CEG61447.1 conserved membrane protein of unknown function [Legionella micdadei]
MENIHLHSLILAQIIGLYLLIMAIIMLMRRQAYLAYVEKLQPSSGVIIMTASLALIIGLFIIVVHNRWTFAPDVVITILGWLIAIKSILWLAVPEKMVSSTRAVYETNWYYLIVALIAIIGIFLITIGFYPFM